MKFEILKPIKRSGWSKPFISINTKDEISLSASAKQILGIEEDGFVGFARGEDGKVYIIKQNRKNGVSFEIKKSGRIADLVLHTKLRTYYNLPSDKLCRLYLEEKVDIDGCEAYKLTA